ncbi:hypothetical protein QBC39DRAFT_412631 [Podospora conica]|nr:hypothetical protein QBC39DRAFT_412631 [Schizothecium conicum]
MLMAFFQKSRTTMSSKRSPPLPFPLSKLGDMLADEEEETKKKLAKEEEKRTAEESGDQGGIAHGPSTSTPTRASLPSYDDVVATKPKSPSPPPPSRSVLLNEAPLRTLLTLPDGIREPGPAESSTGGSHQAPSLPRDEHPPTASLSDDSDDDLPPPAYSEHDQGRANADNLRQAPATYTLRGRYVYKEKESQPSYEASVLSQPSATKTMDFSRCELKSEQSPDLRAKCVYEMARKPFFYQSAKTGLCKTGHEMSLKGRGSAGLGREISVFRRKGIQGKGYRAVIKWNDHDDEDEDGVLLIKRGLKPIKEFFWTDSRLNRLGRQALGLTGEGSDYQLQLVTAETRRVVESRVAVWMMLVWDSVA